MWPQIPTLKAKVFHFLMAAPMLQTLVVTKVHSSSTSGNHTSYRTVPYRCTDMLTAGTILMDKASSVRSVGGVGQDDTVTMDGLHAFKELIGNS